MRIAGQLQQVAAFEIDEHKAGARIDEEIAERRKEQVAREVGDRQHAVFADANETCIAAAMRYVDLPAGRIVGIGRDEERIGGRDHRARVVGELVFVNGFGGRGAQRVAREFEIAHLNVLRTVAEALAHVDVIARSRSVAHGAVQAITPARTHLDAEQADCRAVVQPRRRRIARIRHGIHTERASARGLHESRLARDQRRPYVAFAVHGSEHDKRKLRKKRPMLVRHVVPYYAASDFTHALGHADAPLKLEFARMPGGTGNLCRSRIHDYAPYRKD